jgi:hypothetical protein
VSSRSRLQVACGLYLLCLDTSRSSCADCKADGNKREEPERRTGLIVKDDARTARPITRAKPSRRRLRGVGS